MNAVALLAFALAAAVPSPDRDARRVLLEGMEAETARSMERLRITGYEAPYFIAYQVKELLQEEVAGRFGAVSEDRSRHDRKAFVDVRVGSYALDSSARDDLVSLLGPEGQTYYAPRDAPVDDDPVALRNALWLLTDEKYKQALSSWFRKKSKAIYRAEERDAAPSLSREPPQRHVDDPLPFAFDRARWRGEVRRLTALFRDHPQVFDSSMKVTAEKQIRWLTNSEGSALVTEQALFGVHVQAMARAVDGQLLENSRSFYARQESGLPSPVRLEREVRALLLELEALRTAPALDPYTGPAILAPDAAGVLFHEAIGHRLEGERQDDEKEGQTFKGQLGKPILPSFLTVIDDPTLREQGEISLNGHYGFDDQGVPAQRTVLVEGGVLRTFLLSRKPVNPFPRSNGHGRSQGAQPPTARMGNLIVSSSRNVPMTELKRMLIEEAKRQGKPYGLIIQDITGGNTNTMSFGYQAFKGTPRLAYRVDVATGRQELVRGVELVGTPLTTINKVLATGGEPQPFNGFCGAESGYVPVSTLSPATLISEIELQRVTRANERSPVLPAPWNDGAKR
jgi:predicted Zn-dependent protease